MVEWNDKSYKKMARVVIVIISTLFPTVAVLSLYLVKDMVARLGAVLGFSALFSIVLAVFTNARPVEIFAATAAYVDVHVSVKRI